MLCGRALAEGAECGVNVCVCVAVCVAHLHSEPLVTSASGAPEEMALWVMLKETTCKYNTGNQDNIELFCAYVLGDFVCRRIRARINKQMHKFCFVARYRFDLHSIFLFKVTLMALAATICFQF